MVNNSLPSLSAAVARRIQGLVLFALLICGQFVLCGSLDAASAPTKEEWAPLKAAIESNQPSARSDLGAFMQNRVWPDGFVRLAKLDVQAGDFAACVKNADQGLTQALAQKSAPNDVRDRIRGDAAWLLVHGYNKLGQPEKGPQVLERFGRHKDVGGLLHFYLAQGSMQQAEYDQARDYLAKAKELSQSQGQKIPLDFRLVEARIFEKKAIALADSNTPDAARLSLEAREAAADCYQQALREAPEMTDVMFNLARMQHNLAHEIPEEREIYLNRSVKTYETLLHVDGDDSEARVGLALVLLEKGGYVQAESQFAKALQVLESDSDARASTIMTAYRGQGTATLKMAEENPQATDVADAFRLLEKAKQLGDESPELYNNLLVAALQLKAKSTDPSEQKRYQDIADEAQGKAGGVAPLNLALASFENGRAIVQESSENHLRVKQGIGALNSAAGIYQQALGLSDDSSTWNVSFSVEGKVDGPTWRFLGHAHSYIADLYTQLRKIEGSGYEAEIAQHRDAAGAAYRAGGNLVDVKSRDFYLAHETTRSGAHGYEASWNYLSWKSYLSPTGWFSMMGNYGSSEVWKSPVHLGVWGVLFIIPLFVALKGLLIGKKITTEASDRSERGAALTSRGRPAAQVSDEKPKKKAPSKASAESDKPQEKAKDATFVPNTVIRTKDGALERRGEQQRRRSSSQDVAQADAGKDETMAYSPSTDAQNAQKSGEKNKAAAQVAKRLASKKAEADAESPAPKRPPQRRRRR